MSSTTAEYTLDFGPAMSHFQSMFPDLSPTLIESVLRKHNGDVSSTIDDLLMLASKSCSTSSQFPDFASSNSVPCQKVNVSAAVEKQKKPAPNCADDEKIALLIQNREFLKYLRQDPQFMREISSDHKGSSPRHRLHRYSSSGHGRLLSASKPFQSPHNHCYSQPSPPPVVPNGPLVDFSQGSIPNGPMVDCLKTTPNWSQKLKSHLPLVNKPSFSKHQEAQPTVAEMYASETTPDDYIQTDEHLTSRLHNMSRNSKTLLLTLAKKFSVSKRGSSSTSMRPTDFGEQSKDFSFQIHQH